MPEKTMHRLSSFSLLFLLAVFATGCSKSIEYFEEMEMMPIKEKLLEYSLGHYGIPVPIAASSETTEWTHGNTIHIGFDLFAVIDPSDEKAIVKSWLHHEGNFRNDALRICRSATIDELNEPGLSTLKGRLTDAVGRYFGDGRIRRLVMNEVRVLPL